MTNRLARRAVLRATAVGAVGMAAVLAGCSAPERAREPASTPGTATASAGAGRILIACFSRPGENYHYGGRRVLEVGNTEVLAGLIRDRTGADIYRIRPADPYPAGYDEAVARNRREQDSGALPAIAVPHPDITGYDVVMLGSPVWSSQAPRIMSTFINGLDFTGKTVLPFVTYAVSGISGIDDFYRRILSTADVTSGLAVRGEEAEDAGGAVDAWLRTHNLVTN